MESSQELSGLVCGGFRVGRLFVPPFQVSSGEIIKLIFPRELASEKNLVARALCRDRCDGLRTSGHVIALECPMTRSRLLEVMHRQTAPEWLTVQTGMTEQHARTQLKRVQVSPDAPISTLAGNPRWLIGFLAAIHECPAAVIFSDAGLDPGGIQQALTTVNEQLGDAAGVYLTCLSNVDIKEPEYAAVLGVTASEPEPVT